MAASEMPLHLRLAIAVSAHLKIAGPKGERDREDEEYALDRIMGGLWAFRRAGGDIDSLVAKLQTRADAYLNGSRTFHGGNEMELLDINDTMTKVSKLTGMNPDACEKVIGAVVDVLHDEMERRNGVDPTLYGQVQDGNYRFDLGEHLEPANFLPGDFWTEVCRRSQTPFPDAEKVVNAFRDLWVVSGKFFEPMGEIVTNGKPAHNTWYSVTLRRDFVGPPSVTFEDDPYTELGGEG